MDQFFLLMCVSIGMVVLIGFFNEKVTRMPNEIALMLFATIIGCVITVVWSGMRNMSVKELLNSVQVFNLEKFLLHGVLCFMLFAGSCHLRLNAFVRHARQVGVLAFFCTLVGALLYGTLFYLILLLTPFRLSLPIGCILFAIQYLADTIRNFYFAITGKELDPESKTEKTDDVAELVAALQKGGKEE